MEKLKVNKSNILFFVIGGLSIINIFLSLKTGNLLSNVLSILGLVAFFLFFIKKRYCDYFLWIWIVDQALILDYSFVNASTNIVVRNPFLTFLKHSALKLDFIFREIIPLMLSILIC
jgi:hypothetical protein